MRAAASLPSIRGPLVLGAFGTLAVAVSWVASARTVRVGHQADWAIVGVAGSAAIVLAALLWVLAARRTVEQRLGDVLARLDAGAARPLTAGGPATGADTRLVASPAMAHYHRPGCPLSAGKPVAVASRRDHEAAGRRPCGVCRP
jgi:hypothetical protein